MQDIAQQVARLIQQGNVVAAPPAAAPQAAAQLEDAGPALRGNKGGAGTAKRCVACRYFKVDVARHANCPNKEAFDKLPQSEKNKALRKRVHSDV